MRRDLLARAPLPLLALSAAWGVWQFQMLFTPAWVAALSAVAFEAVYVSLSFAAVPDARRATAISVSAVAVSVLYNTLSSLFHLRPALLDGRALWLDMALAVLHGAPLAIVAYAVADLLLHRRGDTPAPMALTPGVNATQVNVTGAASPRDTVRALVDGGATVSEAARQVGVSRQTASRWKKRGE